MNFLLFLGFVASVLAVPNPDEVVKDSLGDRAVIRDPVNEVDYRTLYRDGLKLQSELLALEKTVGGQRESSASILAPFFPNLGFFQQPAIPEPIPYAASTLPMYPGFAVQFTESLTNLITEVIKRQQEILQMIVGCNCGEPIEEVPVVTTTTVTPPVALKLNRAAPSVDIPFGTRLPTIIPSVAVKKPSVVSVQRLE